MKKLLLLAVTATFALSLSACKDDDPVVVVDDDPIVCDEGYELVDDECVLEEVPYDGYEIAMITDSGGIDDESFNQGTWEGIKDFADENGLTYKYYKPITVSDSAYLDAIALAVEGNAKIIVTPGFLFETSIHAAQDLYPDIKFVLIDGSPHNVINWGDMSTYDGEAPDFTIASNTKSIFFNEHESGFLAGYAAVKDGFTKLGFTGGMAVPAVVKFGIGYIAGAYYAAAELSIDITFNDDTYHYFGDFGPSDTFKTLAASWYTSGTEIIFSAAGGAGASVMAAAADAASDAWMIGVDIDQASQGDTVLTSAMKQLGNAVKDALQEYVDGTFTGGSSDYKGVTNGGVALPMATSRFDNFSQAEIGRAHV